MCGFDVQLVCAEGAPTTFPLVAGDDAVRHNVEHRKQEETDLQSKEETGSETSQRCHL